METVNDFYVYVFINKEWNEPFYVGKGFGNRINDNNRNKHIKAILERYPCERFKVREHLSEPEAFAYEIELKKTLMDLGKPIIDYELPYRTERRRAGIERAKKEGKFKGGKSISIDEKIFDSEYQEYVTRKITKSKMAENLKISRPTLDRLLKEKGLIK